MDDLVGSLAGGIIGGLIGSAIPWLKYRDSLSSRLRDGYCDLFTAVDAAVRQAGDLYWNHRANPNDPVARAELNRLIMSVNGPRVRMEFMETRESCLQRLTALKTALEKIHQLKDGEAQVEFDTFVERYNQAALKVIDARDELMREAKLAGGGP
jgi:hypothetical protein